MRTSFMPFAPQSDLAASHSMLVAQNMYACPR